MVMVRRGGRHASAACQLVPAHACLRAWPSWPSLTQPRLPAPLPLPTHPPTHLLLQLRHSLLGGRQLLPQLLALAVRRLGLGHRGLQTRRRKAGLGRTVLAEWSRAGDGAHGAAAKMPTTCHSARRRQLPQPRAPTCSAVCLALSAFLAASAPFLAAATLSLAALMRLSRSCGCKQTASKG